MNKILRNITYEMFEKDLDYINIKKGNYRVVRNNNEIKHYYYGNLICKVDINEKKFELHNCGYEKYPLTTSQLNFLETFYKNRNYELTFRGY